MANTPKGATITVVIICAPQITACSTPIGIPMWKAFFKVLIVGRNFPLSPTNLRSRERVKRYHIIKTATTNSANPVPQAAPSTPKPAPGTQKEQPNPSISREGKIKKKLKTTSKRHMSMLNKLGTRIFPLQRSMPADRMEI